jgi:hypothetical protein
MLDANIPDIAFDRDRTVKKVRKKKTNSISQKEFFVVDFSYWINFVLILTMKKPLFI